MVGIDQRLRFILVTGNPGSGKTTLGSNLIPLLPGWKRVEADGLAKDYELRLRAQGRTGRITWSEIRAEGYERALWEIDTAAQMGGKTLVEATIPTARECAKFVNAAHLAGRSSAYRIIQLRCRAETHFARRIADRTLGGTWGTPNSDERRRKIEEVWRDPLCTFKEALPDALVVDTSELEPRAVLTRVLESLESR